MEFDSAFQSLLMERKDPSLSLLLSYSYRGNIKLTFSGKFLDSVAHPTMVTTALITAVITGSNPP